MERSIWVRSDNSFERHESIKNRKTFLFLCDFRFILIAQKQSRSLYCKVFEVLDRNKTHVGLRKSSIEIDIDFFAPRTISTSIPKTFHPFDEYDISS